MADWLANETVYLTLKGLHVVSFVAWMAGLFYLPRLFVYHTRFSPGEKGYETFLTMEKKLLKVIMNPAMMATFLFGILLTVSLGGEPWREGWFHLKFTLAFGLAGFQGFLSKTHKAFVSGENTHSEVFFRWINEIPTILLLLIVGLVFFKPF